MKGSFTTYKVGMVEGEAGLGARIEEPWKRAIGPFIYSTILTYNDLVLLAWDFDGRELT